MTGERPEPTGIATSHVYVRLRRPTLRDMWMCQCGVQRPLKLDRSVRLYHDADAVKTSCSATTVG